MAKHPSPAGPPKMVVVKLLAAHGNAFAGEVVGYPEAHAAKLVKTGVAAHLTPTAPSAPPPAPPPAAPEAKAPAAPPEHKMVTEPPKAKGMFGKRE